MDSSLLKLLPHLYEWYHHPLEHLCQKLRDLLSPLSPYPRQVWWTTAVKVLKHSPLFYLPPFYSHCWSFHVDLQQILPGLWEQFHNRSPLTPILAMKIKLKLLSTTQNPSKDPSYTPSSYSGSHPSWTTCSFPSMLYDTLSSACEPSSPFPMANS